VAHGGKRPGAGRRLGSKNRHKKADVDRITEKVLRSVDTVALWKRILHSNSPKTILGALQYLMDRHFGRPAQVISGSGPPIKVEFSWGAVSPDWLSPEWSRTPAVETRAIPQQIEEKLEHIVSQIEDDNKE
jgi:hypothetical protein